jgi:hypothetical protein
VILKFTEPWRSAFKELATDSRMMDWPEILQVPPAFKLAVNDSKLQDVCIEKVGGTVILKLGTLVVSREFAIWN